MKKQRTARNFLRWLKDKTHTQVHSDQPPEDLGTFRWVNYARLCCSFVSSFPGSSPDPHFLTGIPLRCHPHCWLNLFWLVIWAFTEESSTLWMACAHALLSTPTPPWEVFINSCTKHITTLSNINYIFKSSFTFSSVYLNACLFYVTHFNTYEYASTIISALLYFS